MVRNKAWSEVARCGASDMGRVRSRCDARVEMRGETHSVVKASCKLRSCEGRVEVRREERGEKRGELVTGAG